MTVTVETGAGVRLANSYITRDFVTTYLTARNRETAWLALASDAIRDAAVVAAADYIEHRWGCRFKGTREFTFEAVFASATITFTGLPANDETLTLGDQTYTFKTALSSPAVVDEILIGADATEMATNTASAINATAADAGTLHSTGTVQNRHASATADAGVVTLTARADGSSGNETVLSETAANTAVTAFTNGLDGGSQPLSFPQVGLFDGDGVRVNGIPLKLKQAQAEYADRARAALLAPDPQVDDRGAAVKRFREKVGPIEEETEYVDGSHLVKLLRPYPAADRLLKDYVHPAGMAIR